MLWFNPFIWLYKKAIAENHEYLADDLVIKEGINLTTYLKEIVQSINKKSPLYFSSGFNYLQTKNRLIMLNKEKSNTFVKTTKLLTVITLSGAMLFLNSFTNINDTKPLLVVIDAGHGGKDDGASNNAIIEKEITLSIAKKLEAYNKEGKVQVLLTRSNDNSLTLKDRVDYINKQKPDLFLSLHINTSQNKAKKGVEAYYYEGNHQKKSHNYSKTLISEQFKTFWNNGEIKTSNFFVLKNSNYPGVLLELGFLSNETDHKILMDTKNHHQIAAAIYSGLLEIKKSKQ